MKSLTLKPKNRGNNALSRRFGKYSFHSKPDKSIKINSVCIISSICFRIREVEAELDGEQRRLGDASKNLRKAERRIKELDFQAKMYIPNTIKTQKNIVLLPFGGRHGSTEIFCNFSKSILIFKVYKIKSF